jgi:excisionase family DNA binding protein
MTSPQETFQRREALARSLGATALQLYSVPEACDLLGVSRWQLYQLMNQRQLGSVKIGRRRLIPARDLERFVLSLSTGAIQ